MKTDIDNNLLHVEDKLHKIGQDFDLIFVCFCRIKDQVLVTLSEPIANCSFALVYHYPNFDRAL